MATYKSAGVDIDAGNEAVRLMRSYVRATYRPEVLADIGGFGGLFALDIRKYPNPVLVSGADGVGTKLKIAFMADKHDTIGQDAVAMCVNDILVQGAEPLFFLDYLAVGKLVPSQVAEIVSGVADGCRLAGCALIGGETAEMPGFYAEGEYDLAGFAVGVVNRESIVDGQRVRPGDVLIGLHSSGLHSNGFSLVRHVFFDRLGWKIERHVPELGKTLGEELLAPTRIYVRPVLACLERFDVRAMAHITGGGLPENVLRSLPEGLGAVIRRSAWEVPPIFALLQELGDVPADDMARTFNLGIGFVLVVPPEEAGRALEFFKSQKVGCAFIGEVVKGEGVRFTD